MTDLGQFKLNDYYFPLNSAASVLNEYRNYQKNKKEEGELWFLYDIKDQSWYQSIWYENIIL